MRSAPGNAGTLFLSALLVLTGLLIWLWPRYSYLPARGTEFDVVRLGDGPIIDVSLGTRLTAESATTGYSNLNYPALIRVPDWVENPLGTYYL